MILRRLKTPDPRQKPRAESRNRILRTRSTDLYHSRPSRTLQVSQMKFLDKVKNRKGLNLSKVCPKMANDVLSCYILPLLNKRICFEKKNVRNAQMGFTSRVTDFTFSLSEKLERKLNEARDILKRKKELLESTRRKNLKMARKLNYLKNSIDDYTALKKLAFDGLISSSLYTNPDDVLVVKTLEYKIAAQTAIQGTRSLYAKLSSERNSNTILKCNSQQSGFNNFNLTMINIIIGEQLRQILISANSLLASSFTESIFKTQYIQLISTSISSLTQNDEFLITLYSSLIKQRKRIFKLFDHSQTQKNIRNRLKSFKISVLSMIQNLDLSISSSKSSSISLAKEIEDKEKQISEFMIEYDFTKKKLVEKQRINNKYESICSICFKSFKEDSNFNWSCVRHTSDWNGIIYWCCGSRIETQIGCTRSKHVYNEEIEENDVSLWIEAKKENVCTGCKKVGHLQSECLMDPNSERSIKQGNSVNQRIKSRSIGDFRKGNESKIIKRQKSGEIKLAWKEIEELKLKVMGNKVK